jgi:hypothetical protein
MGKSKMGEYSPEEIKLMQDHIDNWNPFGNVVERVARGDIAIGCLYIKKEIMGDMFKGG